MDVLSPSDCAAELVCVACQEPSLAIVRGEALCSSCARRYRCERGVIDFVDTQALDHDTRREREANGVALENAGAVRRRVRKGDGNPLLMAQTRRSMRAVLRLLEPYDESHTLVSVGSGCGFELRTLLGLRRFRRVYSSDLAWSATALVPQVVSGIDGSLGLFAADFGRLPLARRPDRIGLCHLALHHAPDPHAALELLLARFDQLVVVEPIDNWLVDVLARCGQARRVEYSGAQPRWLDIRRMRRLARQHGYAMDIETWWEIPRSRLPRRMRRGRRSWWPLYAIVEGASRVGQPWHFGSMAAVRFRSLER